VIKISHVWVHGYWPGGIVVAIGHQFWRCISAVAFSWINIGCGGRGADAGRVAGPAGGRKAGELGRPRDGPVDWAGAALLSFGLVAVLLVTSESGLWAAIRASRRSGMSIGIVGRSADPAGTISHRQRRAAPVEHRWLCLECHGIPWTLTA